MCEYIGFCTMSCNAKLCLFTKAVTTTPTTTSTMGANQINRNCLTLQKWRLIVDFTRYCLCLSEVITITSMATINQLCCIAEVD